MHTTTHDAQRGTSLEVLEPAIEKEQTESEYYDTYWTQSGFNPIGRMTKELRQIYERWVPTSSKVLDVGCGDCGTSAPWLIERKCEYSGVDISRPAISRGLSAGFDARVIESADKLPFDDGTFDVVTCIEVLEHLFDPIAAAVEALRVLKAGGRYVVTVPNATYWRRRIDMLFGRWNPLGDSQSIQKPWRDPHIRFFNGTLLKRMLVEAGFSDVMVGGHGGAFLADLPLMGRFISRRGSIVYKAAERTVPNLFGYGVHAIAIKK